MDAVQTTQRVAVLCVLDIHLATLEAECKQALELGVVKNNLSERTDVNITASAAKYMREKVWNELLQIAGDTITFIQY